MDCPTTSTTTTTTTTRTSCPDWTKVKNGVCDSGTNIPQCVFDGGDCLGWHFVGPYLLEVLSGLHTFPEAKDLCHEMEGRVFEPRNHSDLWLMQKMPLPAGMGGPWGTAENVWTGINDIGKNDVYVYDSSNETVEMNMHWYPLQPDNTTEEIYVSVQFPEVKYLDREPEYTAIVICEKI